MIMPGSNKVCSAIRNMFINWPPLIVFIGTLVILSCVTFFLGVYVYHTEGILDLDTETWNKFLSGLDESRFCPVPVSSLPHISTNQNHSSVISFMLQGGKEEHLLANETAMQLAVPRADGLNITLEPVRAVGRPPLLCVRITRPAEDSATVLPSARLPAPPGCDATTPGHGTFEVKQDTSWRRCAQGGGRRLRLHYRPTPEWDVVITKEDQQRIYTHLSVTSVFLVVMAFCMLAVTAARNRPRYTLTPGDKVPIMDGQP